MPLFKLVKICLYSFWGQLTVELIFLVILDCIYEFLKGLGAVVTQTKYWGKVCKKKFKNTVVIFTNFKGAK